MAIEQEITRPISKVFRNAYIKRRSATTGLYESDWYEITDYVKRWGTITREIDYIRLNNFRHSGISLICKNDDASFNPESHLSSLWYGYLTRFRTLVKVEAGYIDDNGIELPTTSVQGVFIITDEINIDNVNNEVVLNCKSLQSVFDEVLATEVSGLGTIHQTASELITHIKDHTDGSGNFIFQQFISSGAWYIQTTTSLYNIATSTSIDGKTCWELINLLSESEGYVTLINRTGGFEFRDRNLRTSTMTLTANGLGYSDQNILQFIDYKEPMNRYYNYFRMKYLTEETATSYVSAGTITTVDPSSSVWKYGARIYTFENTLCESTAAAQNIVNTLRNTFDSMKTEFNIDLKFIPHMELLDQVSLSYLGSGLEGASFWDVAIMDVDRFSDETKDIINLEGFSTKILSLQHNLDNFVTNMTVREI